MLVLAIKCKFKMAEYSSFEAGQFKAEFECYYEVAGKIKFRDIIFTKHGVAQIMPTLCVATL